MDYVIIHSTLVLRSCWCCLHGDGTHAPHTHTHRFLHALWWWWNRHFRPDAHTSYVCLGKIEWRWWLFFSLVLCYQNFVFTLMRWKHKCQMALSSSGDARVFSENNPKRLASEWRNWCSQQIFREKGVERSRGIIYSYSWGTVVRAHPMQHRYYIILSIF